MKNDDDGLLTLIFGVLLVTLLGPGLAAKFLPKAQELLLRWGVLVDDGILIPIGDTAGLDLARTAIVAGLCALLVLLAVVLVRRSTQRRQAGERR
ncbi:MAG: hypothetical protein QM598_05885 [Protaetiibacter sp.]